MHYSSIRYFVIAALLLVGVNNIYAESTNGPELKYKVISVQEYFPEEKDERSDFLGRICTANNAWMKSDLLTTTSTAWEANYLKVSEAMINVNGVTGGGTPSLKSALMVLLQKQRKQGGYLLPAAAIWCLKKSGGGVWIIALFWEMSWQSKQGSEEKVYLGHIMATTYDPSTGQFVGNFSCG